MNWDESLFRAINTIAGHASWFDHAMIAAGWRDTYTFPIALTVLYWLWKNWRETLVGSVALAGLVGAVDATSTYIKQLVQRPRPCAALSGVTLVEQPCGGLSSFPSNHAANTAAVAAFLNVLYPKSGWITWPIVGLVGFARVYVGAHYVTDVIAGWLIGGVCGAGVAWLLLQWPKFRRRSVPSFPPISKEAHFGHNS
jgi:undecaprenyl-diphosphatase